MGSFIHGHKWEALYMMLLTFFDDVGESIEAIVRANPLNEFGNEHSFTPSERTTLLNLKDDLHYITSETMTR